MAHEMTRKAGETAVLSSSTGSSWIMALFFATLILPLSFDLAGLRLSPLRIFLLIGMLPLFALLIQGRAGRIVAADLMIFAYATWMVISLVANHGASRLPYGIATASETISSWMLGRILVRGAADFRRIFVCALVSQLVILPAAVYELFTGTIVIAEVFRPLFDTIYRGASAYGRFGLERVYAAFGHPILFGLFCGVTVSNFLVVFQGPLYRRIAAMGLAIGMTFMSLSSAPLIAVVLQIMILIWWWVTRGAWWTLIILTICAYLVVDIGASRSPMVLLISYATFDPHNGWIRIAQFEYGSQAALANPIFGIGINDYPRPGWVPSSVDNFWLVTALRYGMPALLLLAAAVLTHFAAITRAAVGYTLVHRYRIGYLASLVAVLFTLATVHVWDSAYAFIVFLLGGGVWFYTTGSREVEEDEGQVVPRSELTHTRFPDGAACSTPASELSSTNETGPKPLQFSGQPIPSSAEDP